MCETKKTPEYFVGMGYDVRPAENGGFLVSTSTGERGMGYLRDIATFSNAADLLSWLKDGHAAFAKKRGVA